MVLVIQPYLQILSVAGLFHLQATQMGTTKTIEAIANEYEDDKNSMISITEKDDSYFNELFYEEMDNRVRIENSMNMILFGPPASFLRLDAETILHILSHTKKYMIPISRALLIWDIITDGKTAAYLQGREFLAFDSLLGKVPEEDLYQINFGDPSVLKYFSKNNLQIKKRKIGILVAAYRRYFGNNWYTNSSYVNELGYLLCGFPSEDLKQIEPKTFTELNPDVFTTLDKCDSNQTKTLYNIATHPDAYGDPYKWTSHELKKIGNLFACIPREKIGALQLEALTALTADVMKIINQEKLEYFTKQQILRMNPKARRMFILRVQLKNSLDMSLIAKRCSIFTATNPVIIFGVVVALVYQ